MNYCGIDPSLNSTGITIIDKDKKISISKTISSKPKEDIYDRLLAISNNVLKIVQENDVKLIAIENMSFASRGQSGLQLAGLHYLICTRLRENEYHFFDVAPTTLKKFVTGNGHSKKELMLLQIYKKYGVEFDNSDEADAYGLALMALSKDEENKKENETKD